MFEHIKENLYKLKSGFTTSPYCFLPMIITEKENSMEIMQGHITFSPMVDIDVQKRLFSVLKDVADITAINIDNGYVCDTSDLKTLSLSLYHLEYGKSGFKRLNPKFRNIGDVAVILLNPQAFMQALGWVFRQYFHICVHLK